MEPLEVAALYYDAWKNIYDARADAPGDGSRPCGDLSRAVRSSSWPSEYRRSPSATDR